MSTDVTITITGLCLCFLKEESHLSPRMPIWNIVFPCDDRHKLWFDFPDPDPKPKDLPPPKPSDLHKPERDIFIDFHGTYISGDPSSHDGSFHNLLNLADADLHGVEPDGRHSKLKVNRMPKPPRKNGHDEIWMRVPHSILTAIPPADTKNCWLWEIEENGQLDILKGPICKPPKGLAVRIHFQVEDKLRVTVGDGHSHDVFDETFSQSSIDITFDNKCRSNSGLNDIVDIYESVLDGSKHPGKRFVSGKFPIPCLPLSHSEKETDDEAEIRAKMIKTMQEVIMTPAANCDPVGSEPPPGP
jgi:hypothetical protein